MKKDIIIVLLLALILNSCKEYKINDKLKVYGYSLGDSITDEFTITKEYGQYFSSAKYNKDTLFEIYTVGNQISLYYLTLQEKDFLKAISTIRKNLGEPTNHYIGDTISGVKLKHSIEYFLWYDTLTKNSIKATLWIDDKRKGQIIFENEEMKIGLMKKFIPDFGKDDEEVKIVYLE